MPGFNLARKVQVGSQNYDCGLNCLVHVLSSCINNATTESKNALLAAFQRQYGAHYTWADILRELNTLPPRLREQRYSPILRTLYSTAYQHVNNRIALPQVQGRARNTLAPTTMITNEELNILGHYFGLNVESYAGNNTDEDLLAAHGSHNPLQLQRPIGTLKLWMPTQQHNHFSFELPASMDLSVYNPVPKPPVSTNTKTNDSSVGKKIDSWFGTFDTMFDKIFPSTDASNTNATSHPWVGAIKSFFSFLAPVMKMFMGFAAMFSGGDEDKKKEAKKKEVKDDAATNNSYAQKLAAAQAALQQAQPNANAQQPAPAVVLPSNVPSNANAPQAAAPRANPSNGESARPVQQQQPTPVVSQAVPQNQASPMPEENPCRDFITQLPHERGLYRTSCP